MSTSSTVPDRFARWLDAEDDESSVAAYRIVFTSIWLAYDVIDLSCGMTERARNWFPHAHSGELAVLQVALVVSEAMVLRGKYIWAFGVLAAAGRALEAIAFFSLNDFFLGSVVFLLLAHSDGGPFDRGRRPRWVRDVLLLEFGWIYLTTAILKLNPDWLSGGHIYVRTQYLARGLDWPYPPLLERALASLRVDAILAKAAIASEMTLAVVLFARGPYWLGAVLVVAIHAFGALITNVWFFSATMVASVLFVLPTRARSSRGGRDA